MNHLLIYIYIENLYEILLDFDLSSKCDDNYIKYIF